MIDPFEWRQMTLGELCEEGGGNVQTGPFGSQLHASDYVTSGVPSVMPQNIGDNFILGDGIAQITEADAERLSKYRLGAGDIVYARRGDVEKRSLVRAENEGWLCGTGCLRIRLGEASPHNSAFVSYQLGTKEARQWIVRHAVGATMLNLNTNILSSVPLQMPSPSTQIAIAEVLGALDDKIAANTKLAESLDTYLVSVWRAMFANNSTTRRRLADLIADVVGGDWGTSEPTGDSKEEVRCVRGADIASLQRSGLGQMPRRFVKQRSLERRQLSDGDLIIEMSGGSPTQSTGRTVLVTDGLLNRLDTPLMSSNFCKIIRLDDKDTSFLVYALLRHSWSNGEFFQFENGSTGIKNLAFTAYCAIKEVAIPPSKILASFNFLCRSIISTTQSLGEESERLIATRDTMLPQLMSGEIKVKDAERLVALLR